MISNSWMGKSMFIYLAFHRSRPGANYDLNRKGFLEES